jgi:hypothetical protein
MTPKVDAATADQLKQALATSPGKSAAGAVRIAMIQGTRRRISVVSVLAAAGGSASLIPWPHYVSVLGLRLIIA